METIINIERSKGEEIRVTKNSELGGRIYYDLRLWVFVEEDRNWKPTRKGFLLSSSVFEELTNKLSEVEGHGRK
jgi:fibrillarin-like rRNA methylase